MTPRASWPGAERWGGMPTMSSCSANARKRLVIPENAAVLAKLPLVSHGPIGIEGDRPGPQPPAFPPAAHPPVLDAADPFRDGHRGCQSGKPVQSLHDRFGGLPGARRLDPDHRDHSGAAITVGHSKLFSIRLAAFVHGSPVRRRALASPLAVDTRIPSSLLGPIPLGYAGCRIGRRRAAATIAAICALAPG